MLADESVLKLPPPYNCFTVDPPYTLFTLLWRHPTPALDCVDLQDDLVFLGLKSDWKDEVRALHAYFHKSHDSTGSDGSCMKSHHINEAPQGLRSHSNSDSDSIIDGESSDDDDEYTPPSDCSDEEDHYFEVDNDETEPWVAL